MNAKRFLDTNILIYAFSSDDRRGGIAQQLLAEGGVTGIQPLNEFASVARRKLGMSWREIRQALTAVHTLCPSPVPITLELHKEAVRMAERYGYSIFDSLILAAALTANCGTLYSEDMNHGQVIEGLTIRNPFLAS